MTEMTLPTRSSMEVEAVNPVDGRRVIKVSELWASTGYVNGRPHTDCARSWNPHARRSTCGYEHSGGIGVARTDCAVHRPGRAGGRAGYRPDHGVLRVRSDRAEPARGASDSAVGATTVSARRPPADCAGRRGHGHDR